MTSSTRPTARGSSLGITSDRHWVRFCDLFSARRISRDDPTLATKQPAHRGAGAGFCRRSPGSWRANDADTLAHGWPKEAKLPFARIARPEELFRRPDNLLGGRALGLDTEIAGRGRDPAARPAGGTRRTQDAPDPRSSGSGRRHAIGDGGAWPAGGRDRRADRWVACWSMAAGRRERPGRDRKRGRLQRHRGTDRPWQPRRKGRP